MLWPHTDPVLGERRRNMKPGKRCRRLRGRVPLCRAGKILITKLPNGGANYGFWLAAYCRQ
ncbi:hypothetical protein KCP73_18625 [Salmonella enterica subsp. enterica]|nr:hypothetical protein KCP73_18625 [Salmonella enterica subsp. enterica]